MKSRMIVFSIICLFLISVVGCSNSNISTVKSGTLSYDPTVKVGDALDRYKFFKDKNWKAFKTNQNREIVEFNGIFDNQLVQSNCQEYIKKRRESLQQEEQQNRDEAQKETDGLRADAEKKANECKEKKDKANTCCVHYEEATKACAPEGNENGGWAKMFDNCEGGRSSCDVIIGDCNTTRKDADEICNEADSAQNVVKTNLNTPKNVDKDNLKYRQDEAQKMSCPNEVKVIVQFLMHQNSDTFEIGTSNLSYKCADGKNKYVASASGDYIIKTIFAGNPIFTINDSWSSVVCL